MEITERFDVQYYKNIIKEKNTYENATSAQYVERNGTEVYVSFNEDGYFLQEIKPFTYEMIVKNYYKNVFSNPKGNCFVIQVSKLAFGANMTIRATL